MLGDRIAPGASLGSQVMTQEDREALEKQNESLLKELMIAAEESEEARKFLDSQLGRALRSFIVVSKQKYAMGIANSRDDDEQRRKLQYDYDVVCGIEQFFGQLLIAGESAAEHLQMKLGDEENVN